jgi:uncharacterized protein YndB with AHSA1/START domain
LSKIFDAIRSLQNAKGLADADAVPVSLEGERRPGQRREAGVADTLSYELSRTLSVSQEALFNAFLDPAILKTMWGVSSMTVDARPNGQARAHMTILSENWDFTITYQEIIPNEKLRWLVHFDRFPSKEARAMLSFTRTTDGTEVTVQMDNFESIQERDANRAAWQGALSTLAGLIGSG